MQPRYDAKLANASGRYDAQISERLRRYDAQIANASGVTGFKY